MNKLVMLDQSLLASGDDEGSVKVWDVRTPSSTSSAVASWSVHEDFISSLLFFEDKRALLSTAGDATLACYDLRKASSVLRSDDQEDEMTSIAVLRNGRKVVCGAQDGTLLIFSWGRFGDCSDRFPGHPAAVTSLLKVDESTLLTGAEDGLVRVLTIMPNKVLGVVGDCDGFPVEGMVFTADKTVVATHAHDEFIRLWDVSVLQEDKGDDEENKEEGEDQSEGEDTSLTGIVENEDEEEEEEEEEEIGMEVADEEDESSKMSSDSDDSDNDENKQDSSKGGRRRLPTAAEKFYADL